MAKETQAQKDRAEHQAALSRSGYRTPNHFYVDQSDNQPSAEKHSGDGGQAANEADPADSNAGYKGTLQRPQEHAEEVKSRAGREGIDNKSNAPGSSVTFASKAAQDAARAGGISAEEFNANPAEGDNGYTKAEVDAIVAKRSA